MFYFLHLKSSIRSGDNQIFVIFPFLSTLPRFKKTNWSGIIYDDLHKFADVNIVHVDGINQKTALYYTIKLGQIIYNE